MTRKVRIYVIWGIAILAKGAPVIPEFAPQLEALALRAARQAADPVSQ